MLSFTAKYIVIFVKMRMKLISRDEIIKAKYILQYVIFVELYIKWTCLSALKGSNSNKNMKTTIM
jgi:hypothetical protein